MLRVRNTLIVVAVVTMIAGPGFAVFTPPQKIVAMVDATQNFGTTKRTINYYDVTSLSGTVFGQTPMFSVWLGWEDTLVSDYESTTTIAVNPHNGDTYVLAFDDGAEGTTDAVNDGQGDYDLYRIDYQAILSDFVTNSQPAGTLYGPAVTVDGFANEDHPDAGVATVHIAGAIEKIGELARPQGGPFFGFDLDFVSSERLVLMENQVGDNTDPDTLANDHQVRGLNRVSTATGTATTSGVAGNLEGGYNNQTNESWESNELGKVGLDPVGRSEPEDFVYFKDDITGVEGVWIGEGDGGGDDIGFFEITNWTGSAGNGLKEQAIGSSPFFDAFALDQDPTVDPTTNDGSHDTIHVDKDGNLIIGESGFFDSPQHEPAVITRLVTNYDQADSDANTENEITFGAWGIVGPIVPTLDDDALIVDGRFTTYDKSTNQIYIFDIDTGGLPNVVLDVYIYDLDTGTLVYEELNAANHFVEEHGTEIFLRGDITNSTDGVIDANDIDALFAMINAGPTALQNEMFDLTGDDDLTDPADVDELVQVILGTAYGDANLDGTVSFADFGILQVNFGAVGTAGWATADFNGDTGVSFADFGILQVNFGFTAAPAAVPEPATLALLGLGALTMLRRRRRVV